MYSEIFCFEQSGLKILYIFSQYPPCEGFIVFIVVREDKAEPPPLGGGCLPEEGWGLIRHLVKILKLSELQKQKMCISCKLNDIGHC